MCRPLLGTSKTGLPTPRPHPRVWVPVYVSPPRVWEGDGSRTGRGIPGGSGLWVSVLWTSSVGPKGRFRSVTSHLRPSDPNPGPVPTPRVTHPDEGVWVDPTNWAVNSKTVTRWIYTPRVTSETGVVSVRGRSGLRRVGWIGPGCTGHGWF